MTEPTEADLDRAARALGYEQLESGHWVKRPTWVVDPETIAQLIADVRGEELAKREQPTDSAERIDELSRELTEEIEAHRVTREELAKSDAAVRDSLKTVARGLLSIQRAEAAEVKLAEFGRVVRESCKLMDDGYYSVGYEQLVRAADQYEPKP